MDKYSKSTNNKPAILRSIFSNFTGYSSAPASEQEAAVYQLHLNSDNPKLIIDLRKNNGNLKNPKFDAFWNELENYLNEESLFMRGTILKLRICHLQNLCLIIEAKVLVGCHKALKFHLSPVFG
ncbi:hypothetical protein DPMN_057351 [Dreissena polymorpha]|uniref:Uncharacterized protein n=1 Tax=Dreissena polymorpha TaxID=45954 RepID=A0A9D4HBU2_DREPO|nr:hypothetical protein DPMN_057351 [Dreissena polymorpha]